MPGTKRAQACGKLQGALRSVNRFVSSTQQTPYGTLSGGLSLHSCLRKCARRARFSEHRFNRPTPQRSAKARQPKMPRSAPGSHAPTARGRSSWWCGDAPRSRNARAPAPRQPRRRAASRRTRPIVHHRASTHPCAWRGPGPGRWRSWGQIVAHETTLRCLSDSCQLDSGLNELSRVRSTTRRHGEVLSQVRCPGGWRPVIRVAGRPPLERGGGGVGGAVDGRRAATGSRAPRGSGEQGAGSRGRTGGKRDAAGARRAYADFLKNEAAERTRQRPEYGEHAENLDAFHQQATAATAAKVTRGG